MSNAPLLYEVRDAVATLTLNRPDALNALNLELAEAIYGNVLEADEDRSVRCLVITGAGKAFCAGGDVKSFHEDPDGIGKLVKLLTMNLHGAISRMVRSSKPVLMAINGVAAGGGLGFALSGDLVVATESAKFNLAYSRIGASPDCSTSYYLPRLIGVRRAMEMHFLNRTLTAREALDWGLITRVVPDAQFRDEVATMARALAEGPTLAFARAKQLFHRSTHESLETQLEQEALLIAECGRTADFRNGVASLLAKQAPVFEGR